MSILEKKMNFFLIYVNFMLIYVNMSDRQTDGQTYKNYSSEFYNKIDVHLYQHKTIIINFINVFY